MKNSPIRNACLITSFFIFNSAFGKPQIPARPLQSRQPCHSDMGVSLLRVMARWCWCSESSSPRVAVPQLAAAGRPARSRAETERSGNSIARRAAVHLRRRLRTGALSARVVACRREFPDAFAQRWRRRNERVGGKTANAISQALAQVLKGK